MKPPCLAEGKGRNGRRTPSACREPCLQGGITLATRGGVQVPEAERGRAGLHCGASPYRFREAAPGVLGVVRSPQLSPRLALLLPEQLSSFACKGNETAAPGLLWVQTGRPQSHAEGTQIPVHLRPSQRSEGRKSF